MLFHPCFLQAYFPVFKSPIIAILKVLPVNTLNEVKLTPVQYRLLENQQLIRNNVLISNLHETIGSRLFEALLPGELGDHIKHALTHLKNPKKAINIELQFYESDVQLVKYPWELIHYRQPLLLNGAINLTRYIKLPQLIGSSSVERLNILYIESRPKHNEFYHLPSGINNGEYNTIIKEFELLSINNGFNIQKSSPATFKELQRNLSKSDFNVIHFDGHGLIARLCPKCKNVNYPHYQHCQYNGCNTNLSHEQPLGYLAFEMDNGDDGVDWVSSKILSTLLSNSNIKLAILSACRSGEAKGNVVWGGVGPALIQAGIPAVIAMQIPITANSSMHFMQGFYSALAQGKTLGDALTEGRKTLMREPEWFVPVIYWRSKNSNYPFWITNRRENS